MVLSKFMLQAEYNRWQYLGAVIVAGGIATVLIPTMTGECSCIVVSIRMHTLLSLCFVAAILLELRLYFNVYI